MTKNSLLAAALAFASFTALPALAQSTPVTPPAPVSTSTSVQPDAHKTMDKATEKATDKASDKAANDVKPQAKAMPHLDSKAASDSTTTIAPVSK